MPYRAALALGLVAAAAAEAAGDAAWFQQRVRPIFSSRCQGCHNDTLKYSGFSLDSAESARRGGMHGLVITPGDPNASRLYRRVAGLEKPTMPMQGDPLTAEEIAVLRHWIEIGGPWPEEPRDKSAEQAKLDRLAAMKRLEDQRVITEKDRQWWVFRKPVRPAIPSPKNKSAAANPVDALVLASQEEKGLSPAPPA